MLEKYLMTAFGDITTEDSTKKIKINSEKGIYDSREPSRELDYNSGRYENYHEDDDENEEDDDNDFRVTRNNTQRIYREPTPEDEEFWL